MNGYVRFVLSFDNLKSWCERQSYEYRANNELGQIAVNYALLGQPSTLMRRPSYDQVELARCFAQTWST